MNSRLTINLLIIFLIVLFVQKHRAIVTYQALLEPEIEVKKEKCDGCTGGNSTDGGEEELVNYRPIIGIFTQPFNNSHDYIMSSYVKFVQLAGARAVPIQWRDSDEDIVELVSKLNGVLYPGGSTPVRRKDGSLIMIFIKLYSQTDTLKNRRLILQSKCTKHTKKVELVTNLVKEYNEEGIHSSFSPHYPILAICMGFQQITQSEAPYKDTLILREFDSVNNANNVTLADEISESKLFEEMPDHLIEALEEENITYNHHYDGIKPEVFEKYSNLREEYHMLGVSYDEKDQEYVAVIEAKNFPIYGLQFHPEQNIYSWRLIEHASFDSSQVKETEETKQDESSEPSVECVECFGDLNPSESSPSSDDHLNERPVIGIFTQPYNDTHDYIMASYVKFVQLAGARAVPIEWRDSDENITELVSKLNGVLYPGGSTPVRNKDGSLINILLKMLNGNFIYLSSNFEFRIEV